MKEDNFRNLDKMSGELQKQFQAFMELNAKTLQNLHYLKPNGLSGFQNPGELMSKHIAFMMENNQRFFEYAHTSFRFLEAIFAPLAQVAKENTEQSIKKAATISREIQRPLQAAVSTKKAARSKPAAKKKATKTVAKAASAASKTAKTVAKRASSKTAKTLAKRAAPKTSKTLAKSASSKTAAKTKVTKAKSKKLASKPKTSAIKLKASERKAKAPAIKKSASKAKTGSFTQNRPQTTSTLAQQAQQTRSSLFNPVNGNKHSGLSEHQIGHTLQGQGQSDKPKHPFHK